LSALEILSTYERVERATCDESGLTETERQTHVRSIVNVVVQARERPLPYARRPMWSELEDRAIARGAS
jgi:hypothetical protein